MSPYGVDKKIGGDNPSNDSFMENCITKVMKGGVKDKGKAVAICKVSLEKHKGNQKEASTDIDRILEIIQSK
jgi:hypothetical protein